MIRASACFPAWARRPREIEYALRLGIYCFNVESEPELHVIADVARRSGRRAPIALRVNPGVDPHTHHYISTGKHESKFGIPIDRALEVYREARRFPSLEIRGVQMHIGSQITSTTPFVQAIKKMLPLIGKVRALAPDTLQFFDLGGGLGIRYRNERPPTAAEFAAAVRPLVRTLGLRILLEPGRFIVGNGGRFGHPRDLCETDGGETFRHHRRGDERPDSSCVVRQLSQHCARGCLAAQNDYC